jgi:hypothetical protein
VEKKAVMCHILFCNRSKVQGSAPPLTTEVASLIKKVTLASAEILVNKW